MATGPSTERKTAAEYSSRQETKREISAQETARRFHIVFTRRAVPPDELVEHMARDERFATQVKAQFEKIYGRNFVEEYRKCLVGVSAKVDDLHVTHAAISCAMCSPEGASKNSLTGSLFLSRESIENHRRNFEIVLKQCAADAVFREKVAASYREITGRDLRADFGESLEAHTKVLRTMSIVPESLTRANLPSRPVKG